MKAYTDLKQSAQLAILLPTESADMWWNWLNDPFDDVNGGEYDKEPLLHKPVCNPEKAIPCWSLAALLDIIPDEIQDHTDLYRLKMYKENLEYCLVYTNVWDNEDTIETGFYESMVDACYQMIIKLREEKLL